jgi:hypothetical protein
MERRPQQNQHRMQMGADNRQNIIWQTIKQD